MVLDRGLGRGVSLLRDEAAGPIGADAWEGTPRVFQTLDENRDGLVTRADLEDDLGDHAVRLVHGEPAHGPRLPPGSAYGWRANARWGKRRAHNTLRHALARRLAGRARRSARALSLYSTHASVGSMRAILGPMRAILGPMQAILGSMRAILGPMRAILGPMQAILGPMQAILGSMREIIA